MRCWSTAASASPRPLSTACRTATARRSSAPTSGRATAATTSSGTHQPVPVIPDTREQVADPGSAYQIVTMMEGVVAARHRPPWSRRSASRSPARPAPPTTGATPGSSASRPTSRPASLSATTIRDSLGNDETGGHVAAPVFRDFMIAALKDAPATAFRIPPGMRIYRVSAATGLPAGARRGGDLRGLQARHRARQQPRSRLAARARRGRDPDRLDRRAWTAGDTMPAPAPMRGAPASGTGGLY